MVTRPGATSPLSPSRRPAKSLHIYFLLLVFFFCLYMLCAAFGRNNNNNNNKMVKQVIAPPRADGSSTRGGSTSVRGLLRSPHIAKLQAASVHIAYGSCALRAGIDGGSRYRLMSPYSRGQKLIKLYISTQQILHSRLGVGTYRVPVMKHANIVLCPRPKGAFWNARSVRLSVS